MLRLTKCAALLGVVVCAAGSARAAITWDPGFTGTSLAYVNSQGGLKVGDKLFSDFTADVSAGQGALAPGLGEVTVRGIQVGQDWGLMFNGLWQAGPGQLADTTITFKVTADEPWLIKDNGLKLIGYGANNGGSVSVAETVFDAHPSVGKAIAHKLVNYMRLADGTEIAFLEDNREFAPLREIWVVKDVGASGGVGASGFAQLSQFQQTFSQIPEPATLGSLALGGVILATRRRRAS